VVRRVEHIGLPGGKRAVLHAIVASLTATALLAIGILLFGDFGQTEGRILMTTILLAGYGLLALPAGFLLDQGRLPGLASTVLLLAAVGFAVNIVVLWNDPPPEALEKTLATVSSFAVASTQIAALAARRRARDPASVRRLFLVSTALALVLAAMITVAAWAGIEAQSFYRILAAGVVLDVLLVSLQPILALTRRAATPHRLRVLVEPAEEIETTVEAPDFATAAASAIRAIERGGTRVLGVSRVDSESVKERRPVCGKPAAPSRAGTDAPRRGRRDTSRLGTTEDWR
jgi:hypothetical protein